MILYAGAMIMSYSRTQATVAISTGEAELYAGGSGTCESMFCASLLSELGGDPEIKIRSDSTAGISAKSRLGMGRMKNIDIKHLFAQGPGSATSS
jgi:hypothetical protein